MPSVKQVAGDKQEAQVAYLLVSRLGNPFIYYQ